MNRYWKISVFVFICMIAVWGHSKKSSYSDITKEENYLDQLEVAEIADHFATSTCLQYQKDLPEAPIILKVTPSADVEHLFSLSQQKVIVTEVFKGEDIEVGEEIYLYSELWCLDIGQTEKTIERGFVNVLKQGEEYLVFISRKVDGVSNNRLDIYELYNESYISSVFNYQDKGQDMVAVNEEVSTYVPYSEVKDNEFFAVSEVGFEAWNELKSKMLAMYN